MLNNDTPWLKPLSENDAGFLFVYPPKNIAIVPLEFVLSKKMSNVDGVNEKILFTFTKQIINQLVTTAVFRSEARLQVAKDILDNLISSAVFSSELEKRKQNKIIKYKEEHKRQRDIENNIRKSHNKNVREEYGEKGFVENDNSEESPLPSLVVPIPLPSVERS